MTAQTPEIIIHQGKTYRLLTLPLEPYIERNGGRDVFLPEPAYTSTANYRRYVARWEVCDRRLFLTGIVFFASRSHAESRGMVDLEPAQSANHPFMVVRLHHLFDPSTIPVFAEWWTGRLVAATGRMTSYVHAGFASSYASYRIFRVVRGRVNSVRDFDGAEWGRRSGMMWYDDEIASSDDELEEDENGPLPDWRQERNLHLRTMWLMAEEMRALWRPYDAAHSGSSMLHITSDRRF